MNWKAHPPGNVSAQAPNQTNQYLCGRSPINEMVLSHNLIQNQNHQNNHWRNHPNVGQIRDTMRNTVYESLLKHKKASSWGPTRMENMAICFENILLTRIAVSMEDYLNMEKLEDRLEWLILKMKKQFGAWNIMAPTVGVVSSSGSASNNGSSQGFPVMSLASCDQMNPACSTAYSSGYGSSLYEAVKPFYNGHICSGVCSTTLHGHPSSYGFSNGSSNGFLTNAGSNQSQQQTSTCMQTQPMQHRLQSQQLSVSGSFLLNGVSASTSTTDGSKYYGRADNDADSGTREAPSDDMSEDLENSRQYSDLAKQYNGTRQSYNDAWTVTNNTLEDILNPRKYLKVESFNGTSRLRAPSIDQPCLRQGLPIVKQEFEESKPFTPKIEEVKKDFSRSSSETHALVNEIGKDFSEGSPEVKPSGDSASMKEIATCSNQGDAHVDTKFNYAKTEIEPEVTAVMADHVDRKNSEKQTMKVITLTETFTSEQIKEHIASLKLWVGQSNRKEDRSQAMTHCFNENTCELCVAEKLYFEPQPIYCASCMTRIKRNFNYYTTLYGDARYSICKLCFNKIRGENVNFDGINIQKSKMEKKKNNEEIEEPWVQCDKCEGWQHQVCALFNGKRNSGENAEYICPKCYVEDIRNGERTPVQQSDMLGAKDLPRTMLSDHIEERLFIRLKQEREERAKAMGKNFNEVAGAEDLVVRVVLSVDRKLQVKPQFLDAFQEDNYPKEFPYKSKFILLFQKIEGVEVCLFGMYVQEYGARCGSPNQRCVYLSYLDSVKYFRPEIKTVKGEALRTFVYHEILIGYLDYCKKRGFTSCFIWTCPPSKGDDFILYRHPEIQKTPKREKLREWYLAMVKKATSESIVVAVSNLYDQYFLARGESKVMATRLPYFDGDYWPSSAETIISDLKKEEAGEDLKIKGKKTNSRTLKAMGYTDASANSSKDIQLMVKLGKYIFRMKESFILIQLQFSCTRCCQVILFGKRWYCEQCEEFHLCDKCHEEELNLEEYKRHPIKSKKKHVLSFVEVNGVPLDTEDSDNNYENELFESRQTFLNICQRNNYQYDSLRRAKHSSMMILYDLHTQAASSPSILKNLEVRRREVGERNNLKLTEWLDVVIHASQCRIPRCSYANCLKTKSQFKHFKDCKIRSSGGCIKCKTLWALLDYHARSCKRLECYVPRCKDLKERLKNCSNPNLTHAKDVVD